MHPNKHYYPVKILETHLDTFGHLNHANFIVLFEQARWEWITERGYGLQKVQETQIGPVILELQVKYRKELKARQEVVIESYISKYDERFAEIHQEMKGPDDTVFAIIDLKIGCWDLKRRKLIAPTPDWKAALGLGEAGDLPRG